MCARLRVCTYVTWGMSVLQTKNKGKSKNSTQGSHSLREWQMCKSRGVGGGGGGIHVIHMNYDW